MKSQYFVSPLCLRNFSEKMLLTNNWDVYSTGLISENCGGGRSGNPHTRKNKDVVKCAKSFLVLHRRLLQRRKANLKDRFNFYLELDLFLR